MAKNIVIIPASGQIEFSGSSTPATNHTILTTDSSSIELSGSGNTSLSVLGHITASQNISASGEVYGNILNAKTRVKAIGSSLEFAGNELNFVDGGSTGYLFRGIVNGAFEAYHSANKKLETTSSGVIVTGDISASGDLSITNISSSDNFTLDVEGDVTIDANGADIILSDDGTNFGRFKRDTSDFVIKSETNNKDILFKGVDDSSTITALTLDMSNAGAATFNDDLIINGDLIQFGTETDGKVTIYNSNQNGQTCILTDLDGANGGLFMSGSKAYIGYDGSSTGTTKYATSGNFGLTVEGQISASDDFYINNGKVINSKMYGAGRQYPDIFMSASNNDVYIGDPKVGSSGTTLAIKDSNQTLVFYNADGDESFEEKVGIGTATPATNLTVVGNISASGDVEAQGVGKFNGVQITGSLDFATGTPQIKYNGDEVLTIGNDPGGNEILKIPVGRKIYWGAVGMTGNTYIGADSSTPENLELRADQDIEILADNAVYIYKSGAAGTKYQLYVSQSGTHYANPRVGIGTNTPSNALEVVGDISASRNIYTNYSSTPAISSSGDINARNISAFSLNVTNVTSSNITSSVIETSGSNVFGDASTDTHTFVGDITASGHISASGDVLAVRGNFPNKVTTDLIASSATTEVHINDNLRVTGNISASGDIYVHDQKGIHFGEEVGGHNDVHLVTTGTNGRLLVSGSASSGIVFDSKFSRIGIGNETPSHKLTVEGDISASGAIYVDTTEIVDSSGNINNRFQIQMEANPRITTANRWFVSSGHSSLSAGTQLATSDPDGTSVSYLAAARYKSYIAPRACKLIRGYVTILNYTNDDDIIVTFFKGTAVSDSADAITINQIGNTFAPSMTEDKTYFVSQDFSSGNTLSANDFILVTYHSTSVSSTSYPHVMLNFELQYT